MIIPLLQFEPQVQVGDLMRFDANKSLLVKGSVGAINSVKIKPGADEAEIEVYSATPNSWFLDILFASVGFDIDTTNNKINFVLVGENETSEVVVAPGTYTLESLMPAIVAAFEADDVEVSCSLDDADRLTILLPDGMNLVPTNHTDDLLPLLGFTKQGQTQSAPIENGFKKITLTVATPTESVTKDYFVEVYSPEGDALFSTDADLISEEPDIMKWLPKGRSSFMYLHRKAQKLILDWVDRKGYRDGSGDKITKFAFVDKSDVNTWSMYIALRLFFKGAQNSSDDVFKEKANEYEKHEITARDRFILTLDLNQDGKADAKIGPSFSSGRMLLR